MHWMDLKLNQAALAYSWELFMMAHPSAEATIFRKGCIIVPRQYVSSEIMLMEASKHLLFTFPSLSIDYFHTNITVLLNHVQYISVF